MNLPKTVESTLQSLLAQAATDNDVQRYGELLALAEKHGVRVTGKRFTGGGVAGHYGRVDGARIVITGLLVIGVLGVISVAIWKGDPHLATTYVSPLTGLAGICLGWLFTTNAPSVLEAAKLRERNLPPPLGDAPAPDAAGA